MRLLKPILQYRASSLRRHITLCRTLSSLRLRVTPEIQFAIKNGCPVVALESTIVAHGMPYPQNYQVAQEVETILRSKGVIPATIAVKHGIGMIGLSDEELHELARDGSKALKVSTRELSLLMGSNDSRWGATTVASTMTLAHLAGITTFVTGGIGGVHREGHISMDVSTDLTELSRTPVVVICAGIKSILDIPRTLEVLETLAVPTVTFQGDDFPAFFSPKSGVKTPWRVNSADEVADSYLAARDLDLRHGMLVGVPNQDPAGERVENAIQDALRLASDRGIVGQALTPFILKTVADQTEGESLRSNISLVKNNASVGADIAIAISERQSNTFILGNSNATTIQDDMSLPSKVIVIGGAVIDIVAKPAEGRRLIAGTSNPGSCREADGGVGRNVAEVLGRLGCRPVLYTAVGDDDRGRGLMKRFVEMGGMDRSHVVPSIGTATYLAVLDGSGDLNNAVADMKVFEHMPVPTSMSLRSAQFLVMDANPPIHVLEEAADIASEYGVKVCFEPTSVPKARLVAENAKLLSCISYAFPNLDELMAMADRITDTGYMEANLLKTPTLRHEESAAAIVLEHMHPSEACLVVTMGERGVLLATKDGEERGFEHFPVRDVVTISNATGAGDSLCGAFIAALIYGKNRVEAVQCGMEAAKLSVQTDECAVSPNLVHLLENLR